MTYVDRRSLPFKQGLLRTFATGLLVACGSPSKPQTTASAPAEAPAGTAQTAPASTSTPAVASEPESAPTEIRQADSHVHGAAVIAMALDGSQLSVEMETPLYNLLGFEHAPDTDAQREQVRNAKRALSAPAGLFGLASAAGCVPVEAAPVTLSFEEAEAKDVMLDHDHDHDDEDGHSHDDDHDHDDDHSHDDHHDHDEDHAEDTHDAAHDHEDHGDHEDHEGHTHRDALLSYTFECEAPGRRDSVDLALFDAFEELMEVELVYLGPNRQIARSVSRTGERRVRLDG